MRGAGMYLLNRLNIAIFCAFRSTCSMIKCPHVRRKTPGDPIKNALKRAVKDTTKNVRSIHRGGEAHWVGAGFLLPTVFTYQGLAAYLSPFLLVAIRAPPQFGAT